MSALHRVTESEGANAPVFLLQLAINGSVLFVVNILLQAHNYPWRRVGRGLGSKCEEIKKRLRRKLTRRSSPMRF